MEFYVVILMVFLGLFILFWSVAGFIFELDVYKKAYRAQTTDALTPVLEKLDLLESQIDDLKRELEEMKGKES